MQNEKTSRCGECGACQEFARAARDFSKTPTDRRQYKEFGEMIPCERPAVQS